MAAAAINVTFEGAGPLGLALVERGGRVVIQTIRPNSLASAMPELRAGQVLRTVQAASTDGMGQKAVVAMLKAAARPLQLGFEVDEEYMYQPDDLPAAAEPKLPSLPPFPTTLRREPFTIAPRSAQGPTRPAERPESRPRAGHRSRNAPKPARFREPEDL